MKHITFAIKEALKQENWYAALALTLTLPDILGKFAYPALQSNTRYSEWYEKNINLNTEDLDDASPISDMANAITGDNCRDLRNAFLHSGFSEGNDPKKHPMLHGFDFVVTQGRAHRNRGNTGIQLDVEKFCSAICEAADVWLDKNFLPMDRKILNIKVAKKGDKLIFGNDGLKVIRPNGEEVWGEIYKAYGDIDIDQSDDEFLAAFIEKVKSLMFSSGILMLKPSSPQSYIGFDSEENFIFWKIKTGIHAGIHEDIIKNNDHNPELHLEFSDLSEQGKADLFTDKMKSIFSDFAIVFISPSSEDALIGLDLDKQTIDGFAISGLTFHRYDKNIASEN